MTKSQSRWLVGIALGALLAASPAQAKTKKGHKKAKNAHVGIHHLVKRSLRPQRPEAVSPHLLLNCASVLVQDQQSGRTLVEKAPDAVTPIASITKLMTVMVVLDARQNPDEEILIDRDDLDLLRHSRSRLPLGTLLPRKDALRLALMASENRAAHALGRAYPGVDACVAAMNAKARALGLSHTHYVDPAGLGDGNVSSARDLSQLLKVAYTYYPTIREDSTSVEADLRSGSRNLHFINTSRLVRSGDWDIGLSKTGFIDEAGHCLVMQAKLATRSVFIVILNAQGKLTHFGDAARIRRWIDAGFGG